MVGRRNGRGDDVLGVTVIGPLHPRAHTWPIRTNWMLRHAPRRNIPYSPCPTHVITVLVAVTHSETANPAPGRGGMVGRRDKRGDDVLGVTVIDPLLLRADT